MKPLTPVDVVRNYESVILLSPSSNEGDHKSIFQDYKNTLEKYKGELNHLDTWGSRKLGNQIEKNKTAYYFHASFRAAPEAVAELERKMRIDDRVLRFFHLRLDDRVSLAKHVEQFKEDLKETSNREKEREAKFQKKKAARAAARAKN